MDKRILLDTVKKCEAFETEERMGKIRATREKLKKMRGAFEVYNRGFMDGFQDGYGSAVDALEDALRGYDSEKPNNPAAGLPLPVVRDGDGRKVKNYSMCDWANKVIEELGEAAGAKNLPQMAEEVADVITVGISWLNAIGYDEQAREELFREVNDKNRKRGYLGDKS